MSKKFKDLLIEEVEDKDYIWELEEEIREGNWVSEDNDNDEDGVESLKDYLQKVAVANREALTNKDSREVVNKAVSSKEDDYDSDAEYVIDNDDYIETDKPIMTITLEKDDVEESLYGIYAKNGGYLMAFTVELRKLGYSDEEVVKNWLYFRYR